MAKQRKEKENPNLKSINQGIAIIRQHEIFGNLIYYNIRIVTRTELGKKAPACGGSDGYIYVNKDISLSPLQWAYVMAHCILHNCFGHYDLEKVPGYFETDFKGNKVKRADFNTKLWNIACDIYVDRFLHDIRFGEPLDKTAGTALPLSITEDEQKIYDYLIRENWNPDNNIFGVGDPAGPDMTGLEHPLEYGKDKWGHITKNEYASDFAFYLAKSVSSAVYKAADVEVKLSKAKSIANWFVSSFPLLGAIAASFEIIDSIEECRRFDISIAAVDPFERCIYINTSKNFSDNEWRFIMAHEFLHAALLHHRRNAGKDHYLWNIATDYVINGWLFEMQIGTMPEGVLYDPALKNKSAEEVYDIIIEDLRRYKKMDTFRGNSHGDIMEDGFGSSYRRGPGFTNSDYDPRTRGVALDEFYRNALAQGLEYELSTRGRSFIPAGLVEEIRALAVPPIPWDVRLSEWFNEHIRPLEKHRSYAHPSRRQSSTPDIPRPKYVISEVDKSSRTFGVIIDTSGSMEVSEIGKALGAVASYAAARDVPAARVVFCDALPYDVGYMTPDEIAGRVKVVGRGGTKLQPAVDLLQKANDFPKDGPILIITDGWIENHLDIKRPHAYILPKGCRLPFRARGEVFSF